MKGIWIYLSVLMLPHFVNLRMFESGIDFDTRIDDCMPIFLFLMKRGIE